jgi:hypothetical protein
VIRERSAEPGAHIQAAVAKAAFTGGLFSGVNQTCLIVLDARYDRVAPSIPDAN